jgi:hypothetical protein
MHARMYVCTMCTHIDCAVCAQASVYGRSTYTHILLDNVAGRTTGEG